MAHTDELKVILQEKLVQTNEILRCAYLYPMMTDIYERHQKPLAFIEIGASAGLQLGMDHYNYTYNQDLSVKIQIVTWSWPRKIKVKHYHIPLLMQ